MADERDALRRALEAFAAQAAPELIERARAEAVERARSVLVDAMARALLDRVAAELLPASPPRPPATSRRRAPTVDRPPSTPAPTAGPPPSARPPGELGSYVYGVVRAADLDLPSGLAGVDPRYATAAVEHEGLAALTSQVSLAEFGEEELRENLNDVAWLEEKARAHERVLDEARARMTVVPMRLCTIYRGEEQVHEMLAREHDVFVDALRRLEGHTEWGVKVIAAPGALEAAATAPGDEGAEELSPGAAYMRERSREARAAEDLERLAEDWAHAAHERLAGVAAEALRNPVPDPAVTGHDGDMLLNGVYLVADAGTDAFRDEVSRLGSDYAARGVEVELTGPWPAYNFVKGSIEAAR